MAWHHTVAEYNKTTYDEGRQIAGVAEADRWIILRKCFRRNTSDAIVAETVDAAVWLAESDVVIVTRTTETEIATLEWNINIKLH